jgi:co-chaperonin GroES (HSP10)
MARSAAAQKIQRGDLVLPDGSIVKARAKPAAPFGSMRPARGHVTLRARDDLDPTSDTYALPKAYRLTAATDAIGVAEIVDVGKPLYDRDGEAEALPWKPGDIALVSMADVRQQFVLEGQELFSCNSDCLFARLHPDATVEPSLDWVITRSSPLRMTRAVYGDNKRAVLPPMIITGGLPSGEVRWNVCGECRQLHTVEVDGKHAEVTRMLYEEIIAIGPGLIVKGKRRVPDYAVGELVVFSTDWAIPFTVKGELHHAIRNMRLEGAIAE